MCHETCERELQIAQSKCLATGDFCAKLNTVRESGFQYPADVGGTLLNKTVRRTTHTTKRYTMPEVPLNSLAERLRKAAGLSRIRMIKGFVTRSPESEDRIRVYRDLTLSSYVEVSQLDILHVHLGSDETTPATVYLKADSRVVWVEIKEETCGGGVVPYQSRGRIRRPRETAAERCKTIGSEYIVVAAILAVDDYLDFLSPADRNEIEAAMRELNEESDGLLCGDRPL